MIQYFILPIVLFGMITSYEDYKYGKIRNKWVLMAIGFGILMHFIIAIYVFLSGEINVGYLKEYFINIVISLIFGFILWNYLFWSAGDAKLFIAYCVIVPNTIYFAEHVRYFPSIIILINTFLPMSIYLFGLAMVKTSLETKKEILFTILKDRLPILASFYIGISWVWSILGDFLQIESILLYFILIWGCYEVFNFVLLKVVHYFKIDEDNKKYIYFTIAVIRIGLDTNVFNFEFLMQILTFSLLYSFIRVFCFEITKEYFTKEVGVLELKKGDVLEEGFFWDNDKVVKKNLAHTDKKSIFELEAEGITLENVYLIRELFKNKRLCFDTIKIQKTMPFAHLMFIGVLLSIGFGGSFINFIKYIYHTLGG